jgi:hypothetical protein
MLYLYNYYNYSPEPCALNAEFQHFIPTFNQISLLSKQQQQQQEQKQPGSCFFTFLEAFPKLSMWVFGGRALYLPQYPSK